MQLREKKSSILKQCDHAFIDVFLDSYGSIVDVGRGCLYLRRFLGNKTTKEDK